MSAKIEGIDTGELGGVETRTTEPLAAVEGSNNTGPLPAGVLENQINQQTPGQVMQELSAGITPHEDLSMTERIAVNQIDAEQKARDAGFTSVSAQPAEPLLNPNSSEEDRANAIARQGRIMDAVAAGRATASEMNPQPTAAIEQSPVEVTQPVVNAGGDSEQNPAIQAGVEQAPVDSHLPEATVSAVNESTGQVVPQTPEQIHPDIIQAQADLSAAETDLRQRQERVVLLNQDLQKLRDHLNSEQGRDEVLQAHVAGGGMGRENTKTEKAIPILEDQIKAAEKDNKKAVARIKELEERLKTVQYSVGVETQRSTDIGLTPPASVPGEPPHSEAVIAGVGGQVRQELANRGIQIPPAEQSQSAPQTPEASAQPSGGEATEAKLAADQIVESVQPLAQQSTDILSKYLPEGKQLKDLPSEEQQSIIAKAAQELNKIVDDAVAKGEKIDRTKLLQYLVLFLLTGPTGVVALAAFDMMNKYGKKDDDTKPADTSGTVSKEAVTAAA